MLNGSHTLFVIHLRVELVSKNFVYLGDFLIFLFAI